MRFDRNSKTPFSLDSVVKVKLPVRNCAFAICKLYATATVTQAELNKLKHSLLQKISAFPEFITLDSKSDSESVMLANNKSLNARLASGRIHVFF